MKKCFLSVLFLVNTLMLSATHNRAGEITYRQISELTYEVTVTTFTYTLSAADRDELEISWGDNSSTIAPRISKTELPNYYRKNVYVATHTFPGPGIYKLLVQDPNRNLGVENIPNSVNVVFSISSILTVNSNMGENNAPILLNVPFDKAAVGYVFVHNPGAFDEDGDSLSYILTECTSINGEPIENYTLPAAKNSFSLDPVSGDLVWDYPEKVGKYNVAIEVQEWRNGKKIGVVIRDMQIDVYETDNEPPEIKVPADICVEVGEALLFPITATDPDGDSIVLTATSGIFSLTDCPATCEESTGVGTATSIFDWTPCHEAVRSQPYSVLMKVDDQNADVNLVDMKEFKIKVLAPSPVLNSVSPEGKSIRLAWEDYGTDVIAGFHIYRREGSSGYEKDDCIAGLPPSAGFEMVGYAAGSSTVSFLDLGGDEGLDFGKEYCYRIVAVYPNGTESKPSDELITTLVSGVPVMRNVSVEITDAGSGSIGLAWKKPDSIDTIPNANGPYEYRIFRSVGVNGSDFARIAVSSADLNDTTYTDLNINTSTTGYNYKVELWNLTPGWEFMVGEPGYASSLFLEGAPGDLKSLLTLSKNVPWINQRYDIFRYNSLSMDWDSIGTTNTLSYIDYGLVNGQEYRYKVRSFGGYPHEGGPKNLINWSEEIRVVPVDNEAPCPPSINVLSNCTDLYNSITWIMEPGTDCDADASGYNIYYKGINDERLNLLTTINDGNTFSYIHQLSEEALSGCYAVSAFDIAGNESIKSTMVCIDSCNFYEIPNVFTPNGDGINDYLVAKASGLVERVDFKLFSRTGVLIFSTEEPKLNWDGKYKGETVPPGVYFYNCDVFEWRITGLEQFHISGFVHVITEEGASNDDIIY
jgi:gliding motility-associated-like protein